MGLVVGLLFGCALEPIQRFAFGIVLFWGQLVRWRIESPGMTDPFVPASGAIAGAIAGALIALVVLWRAGPLHGGKGRSDLSMEGTQLGSRNAH